MRKLLWLVLALLLLSVSGASLAQDIPLVPCGDLAEADCALLRDSATAMQSLNAASASFELQAGAANLPDAPVESISIRITGEGAFDLGGGALQALMSDTGALFQNLDQLPDLVANALRAISGDLTIVVFLPANLREAIDEPNIPDKFGFSARLVDGFGYLNLNKLAGLDTSGELPRGWIGVDLAELLSRGITEALNSGEIDLSMLQEQLGAMQVPMDDPNALMEGYLNIERVADTTVGTQQAAVFVTTVDVAGLVTSDAYREMLMAQIEQQGAEISKTEMEQALAMIEAIVGSLRVENSQTIGLDDKYVHSTSLTINWPLDLNVIADMFGGDSPAIDPIDISLSFSANLSDFNAIAPITAPEDASVISVDEMIRMLENQ
ncbi:MAG: hypothetical protein JNJ61_17320 [Anaerolineae bacterium]|nr:hypothetical protein [Anaerolineae bacterium]